MLIAVIHALIAIKQALAQRTQQIGNVTIVARAEIQKESTHILITNVSGAKYVNTHMLMENVSGAEYVNTYMLMENVSGAEYVNTHMLMENVSGAENVLTVQQITIMLANAEAV